VQRRTRQQAYGRWNGLINAGPARDHARALLAAGMGGQQIQAAARLSSGAWTKLIYGAGDRPPARRVRPATAARILAIPIPRPDQLAPGQTIDGTGARRRLQALACLGWSNRSLARAAGVDPQPFDAALRGRPVLVRTHHAIRTLYQQLWATPAPARDQRERISTSRTRNRATRSGWLPPMTWDDDTIDNPDTTPHPSDDDQGDALDQILVDLLVAGQRRATVDITARPEVLEALRRLTQQGAAAATIAARLGITTRTVTRLRADLRDLPEAANA
jgi:hypothetical protein